MNLDVSIAYAQYGCDIDESKLELFSDLIQYPHAVYSLETSDFGVVAANTDQQWNGFANPQFKPEQLGALAYMMNQVDEVTARIDGHKLLIDNEASGEHEIIEPNENGCYELSGWSFYKFDKDDILNRILFESWNADDIFNLMLWLGANDSHDMQTYLEREVTTEIDELRRLAYVAIRSIKLDLNVNNSHAMPYSVKQ